MLSVAALVRAEPVLPAQWVQCSIQVSVDPVVAIADGLQVVLQMVVWSCFWPLMEVAIWSSRASMGLIYTT